MLRKSPIILITCAYVEDKFEIALNRISFELNGEQEKDIQHIVPPPSGDSNAPLRALIFDSWFDSYLGIVIMIRIVDGKVKVGDKVLFVSTEKEYEVVQLGVFTPFREERSELGIGEVGFLCASIKPIGHTRTEGYTLVTKHP